MKKILSREIVEAQEEAATKGSIDLTSLFVYPLLFGSLIFNLAVGGQMLEFDLPSLSPLINLAIAQLNQPLDDQNFDDISKIDHIESKVDQDFSDFGFMGNFPSKYEVEDGNSAITQFSSGDVEPPLLQLTNLLTTKLLNNLGDDVVWPRIKKAEGEENPVGKNQQQNPIRMLKKIRSEKEAVFGKKKHYVRRKHVNQMRDK